jgi:hypothetical protein
VRRVLRAPFTARAGLGLAYVVVRLPLAFVEFVFVVATLAFGTLLAVTFVGLPLLAVSGLAARGLGAAHRRLARALLGEDVPPPPPPAASGPGFLGWLRSALRDPVSWRARAYVLLAFPLAALTFAVVALLVWLGAFWLSSPLWWQQSGLKGLVFPFVGAALLLAVPWAMQALLACSGPGSGPRPGHA